MNMTTLKKVLLVLLVRENPLKSNFGGRPVSQFFQGTKGVSKFTVVVIKIIISWQLRYSDNLLSIGGQ